MDACSCFFLYCERLGFTFMNCPLPTSRYEAVTLAHGGGGTLTEALIRDLFLPAFGSPAHALHDASPVELACGRLALTTDSYVVQPLFFPGGDIGKLAVAGTVNDLLMAGACPVALTAGFILEEGLLLSDLRRVADSMRREADTAGVSIVAGDTKVVPRGHGDRLYLNTSGVGHILTPAPLTPESIRPGDSILLTGDIGRHGMAVMAKRNGLNFDPPIASDCAALQAPFLDLFQNGPIPHCARDLTRGGLGGALVELAAAARLNFEIEETQIPILPPVQAACDLLGFDPLFVANEGCAAVFVRPDQSEAALAVLGRHTETARAVRIGHVLEETQGVVTSRTSLGTVRRLRAPSGEQLPRIC